MSCWAFPFENVVKCFSSAWDNLLANNSFNSSTIFLVAVLPKTNDDFLAIVTHPKSVIIQDGNPTSVNLTCVFNRPTNCTWAFNNAVLKEQNYTFADGSKGINTSNCSVILNNAQPSTLYGHWLCSGTSHGIARTAKSQYAIISKLSNYHFSIYFAEWNI